jgi:hypothetical protein
MLRIVEHLVEETMTRQTMNKILRPLKIGFATMALAFVFNAACGDNKPPANPEPPPPTTPTACCQLPDQCVVIDDVAACEGRGGQHMDNAACVDNQCVQQ